MTFTKAIKEIRFLEISLTKMHKTNKRKMFLNDIVKQTSTNEEINHDVDKKSTSQRCQFSIS